MKGLVRIFPPTGVAVSLVNTANGFGGEADDTESFYSFSSFATPPSIYRYDLITRKSTLFRRSQVDFDPDQFETKQVFYTSRDGTRVPMFVIHRKGLALDGDGHLYVIDAHFECVQIFDDAGRLLLSFGREGHGPGEFWLPTGIHIDRNNRIWIADSYNRRVQVFEYLGDEEGS